MNVRHPRFSSDWKSKERVSHRCRNGGFSGSLRLREDHLEKPVMRRRRGDGAISAKSRPRDQFVDHSAQFVDDSTQFVDKKLTAAACAVIRPYHPNNPT